MRFKKPRTEVFVCDDGLEFLIGDMVMVGGGNEISLGEVIDMQSEDDVNAWLARSSLAKVGRRNGRPGPTGSMPASLARQKFENSANWPTKRMWTSSQGKTPTRLLRGLCRQR